MVGQVETGSARETPCRRVHAVVLALLCTIAGVPTASAQFSPVKGREYKEFFNPVNPVRGEAVLGLAIVPTPDAPRSRAIDVWLPARFSGELTVETLTADGRFRGEGAYQGSSAGGTWVSLPLTEPSPARPGDPTTLAVAVRGPGSTLFVARWSSPTPRPAARLRLYVNSRRADIFLRAGASVSRCTAIAIPQPLRFDTFCDLDVAAVPADGRLALVRREQFDEQTQDVTVNVRGLR